MYGLFTYIWVVLGVYKCRIMQVNIPYIEHLGYIPGTSKGCQMDGSWGSIKQTLRVQSLNTTGGCWYGNLLVRLTINTG